MATDDSYTATASTSPGGGDASRPMDVGTNVVAVGIEPPVAGVDAHADVDRCVVGPRLAVQAAGLPFGRVRAMQRPRTVARFQQDVGGGHDRESGEYDRDRARHGWR